MRFGLFGSNLADSLSDTPDVDQGGRWFHMMLFSVQSSAISVSSAVITANGSSRRRG